MHFILLFFVWLKYDAKCIEYQHNVLRRGNETQYFIPPLEIALFSGHNCTDGCQTAGADPGDWNCPLIWLGSAGWSPIVWESESHRIILS